MLGLLVPYLLEVLILLLDDGPDGVELADGIDGEVTAVFGEDVGLETDGAAIDMSIQGHDIVGIGQERVGLKIGHHIEGREIGSSLNDAHIAIDALHGGIDHAGGILGGLALDFISRLDEEHTQ